MQVFNIEETWKLLIKYHFKHDVQFTHDVVCRLCGNLLIDARQAPCGCRFCVGCIGSYLRIGGEFCPGNLDECKEEKLEFNRNMAIDHVTNRKISKLRIICPISTCTFEDELRNIEQHVMMCGMKDTDCSFSQIGCIYLKFSKEEIVDHLKTDAWKHTELLLESINNLKNEVKASHDHFEEEIRNMKLVSKKLICDNKKLEEELKNREKAMEKFGELNQVNNVNYFPILVSLFVVAMVIYKNINNIGHLQQSLEEVTKQWTRSNDDIDRNSMNENHGELIWKISDIRLIQKAIEEGSELVRHSPEFYTHPNGYKMRLKLSIYRFSGVTLVVEKLKSEYEQFLPKTMKYVATIGIFHRESRKFNTSRTKQSTDYDSEFIITKSEISEFAIRNESLVLKCLLSIIR